MEALSRVFGECEPGGLEVGMLKLRRAMVGFGEWDSGVVEKP